MKFLILPVVLIAHAAWSPFGFEERDARRLADEIGDVEAGRRGFDAFGCGTCHMIEGNDAARGLVGPPLDHMARRVYIAGQLRNTPAKMVAWVRNPREIEPGTAMPDLGLSEQQARDIAAYLYTLR